MKRNGSKNKFITCFRPGFPIEEMIREDGFSKSASKIDRSKSHASLIPTTTHNGILDRSVSDCSAFSVRNSESDETPPRLPRRKSFSRAVKAIVSEMFHSPRSGSKDRKSRNRGSDFVIGAPSLTRTDFTDLDEFTSSSSTSSSSSMGSVSGSDSESPWTTRRTRKPDPNRAGNLTVFLLVLVSLAVTVLGGKLVGVALTSVFLYLMPRRRGIVCGESGKGEARRSPAKGRSSETEYRKQRVVMEGMLKRSNRRENLN
ncbi:hypothetical protein LINGRAHAP2_LOCUS18800 [Linum grandiflorum]